jgi:hypothetical protein
MADQKIDPFAGHEVSDPDYVSWEIEGTRICGVLKVIRESPGRNNKLSSFCEIYVGSQRTVVCSAPTILLQKLRSNNAIGCAVRVEYTHEEKTQGGNLKRFEVAVLPRNTDLKAIDSVFWGVFIPQGGISGSASVQAPPGEVKEDDLPF